VNELRNFMRTSFPLGKMRKFRARLRQVLHSGADAATLSLIGLGGVCNERLTRRLYLLELGL
jgi:hypothetical protein